MKRGNTALKRVVSVASVAAMAIAGAVLAAPAASAATLTAPTGIRATPTADAAALSDPYNALADYSTTGTGPVPVVTVGAGQAVSDVQVVIPVGGTTGSSGAAIAAQAAFVNGNSFPLTLTAPAGLTFATRPTATLSGLVNLDTLATNAGASTGHAATAVPAALVSGTAPTASASAPDAATSKIITVTLSGESQAVAMGSASAQLGYVVNISGLRVTADNTVAAGPIVVNSSTAAASTVVGYLAPFTVAISGDATGYPANAKGAAALPDITVTETSKNAFVDGFTYGLAITGTDADSTHAFSSAAPTKVTPSSKLILATPAGLTAGQAGTSGKISSGATTDDLQSLTFSGATISNYKAGSQVKVGLTVQNATPANIFDQSLVTTPSALSHTTVAKSVQAVTVSENTSPDRTAGSSRYDTAKKIAAEYGTSNTVVLANGIDAKLGIDALAANYLAGAKSAPILLTDSSANLPQATKDAIAQVLKNASGTVTVYVLGRTDSVSDAAADQAKFVATAAASTSATVKLVRIEGSDRYATAAAALKEAGSASLQAYNLGSGSYYTAFLASGKVNADALAAGALSAGSGIPVILTDGNKLNDDEAAQLKALNIQQLIVLGSTDRVTDALVDSLKADNGIKNVVRVAGTGADGRFNTAAELNTLAIKGVSDKGLGINVHGTAYLANGLGGFADALTVGPLAGKNTNPVLTVPADKLPAETSTFLTTYKSVLTSVSALGQSDRITDDVITAAQKAIL